MSATRFFFVLSFWSIAMLGNPGYAQTNSAALKAGEYLTDGGSARLVLKAGSGGAMSFSIDAVGGNMHTCSLEGEVRGGRAVLDGTDAKSPCIVTFKPGAQGIEVATTGPGSCSDYCGMRASFEGIYALAAPGCSRSAVTATRRTFQQLYDKRQFAEARAKLQPLLKDCVRTLGEVEDGRIRNDLAVTLHKLGELAACREVLAPLAEEAKLTDAQVRDNYPPSDADVRMPVVRATRTNLRLCGDK